MGDPSPHGMGRPTPFEEHAVVVEGEADFSPLDRELVVRALTAARPDYGWLSEETEDDQSRTAHDRVFIVDPIDGTRAFMRGDDTFCHALAIAEAGEIVAAVAYFPIKDQMYWATKGGGAFRDGHTLSVSPRTELSGASALAGKVQLTPSRWRRAAARRA